MSPSEAGTTRIQLCGRLKADVEGRHVTPSLRGRQGRVLLAYLVLNRGRPVSRDELIAAIWPEAPPADPPAALRTQLSRLRTALGSKALAGRDAVELRLPDDTWIDVEAAERAIIAADSALRSAAWKEAWAHAHIALNIAGRPFLAGFDASWVEEVRRELQELHLRSREVIARAGIGLGGSELAGAERAARALIRAAPFRESGYLLLMRALVAAGNTAEALRGYDQLRNLLAEELGSAPGAEIQALHRRLLGGGGAEDTATADLAEETHIAPAEPGPSRPADLPLPTWLMPRRSSPFVGRDEELEHLGQLWEESRAGVRHIVFVGGDPGVGKTRLATEFARRVHTGGASVLYGRGDEEGTLLYLPFIEALRHWAINAPALDVERELGANASALATLVPEITIRLPNPPPVVADVPRDRLFDAVTETLSAISLARPTLLVIDDIHWADAGSLLMLRHLARSAQRGGLMVLATYRETEPSEALTAAIADLGRERLFERLHLSGLSRREVVELVASIRGANSTAEPGLGEAIHEETGGNPFLIEALVDHMAAHSELREPGERSQREAIYAGGVPDLVREAIGHRVEELGQIAGKVLEVSSVIGREFESELLVEVSEMQGEDVISSLEAAVAAGLLTDVPGTLDRYAFSHALFRQTIYSGISRGRRAALHGRLAEVLEDRHGDDPRHVAELARHFAGAGSSATPKALEYGVLAGATALGMLAFDQAVEHYRGALRALGNSGSEDRQLRCELLIALGEAEWRAGSPRASRETFMLASRIARDAGDPEALARAALGFCGFDWERLTDEATETVALLERALETNPEPGPLRCRVLARLAPQLGAAGENDRAHELSDEALDAARRTGDPEVLATALIGRWFVRSASDQLSERADLNRELGDLSPQLRNWDTAITIRMIEVVTSLELGEFAALDVAISEHAKLADQMKQSTLQTRGRAFLTMRALMEGGLEDAERLSGEGLVGEAPEQTASALESSAIELYLLRWEQDRVAELEDAVRDLGERSSGAPIWSAALALLLAEQDRDAEAGAELEVLSSRRLERNHHDPNWLASAVIAALAAVELGDRDQIERMHGLLAPHAERIALVGEAGAYWGPVSQQLGLLASAAARPEEAIGHLEHAISVNERAGALPWLARARFALAEALVETGAKGEEDRVAKLLAEAARTAEQLKMTRLLEQMASSNQGDSGLTSPRS